MNRNRALQDRKGESETRKTNEGTHTLVQQVESSGQDHRQNELVQVMVFDRDRSNKCTNSNEWTN